MRRPAESIALCFILVIAVATAWADTPAPSVRPAPQPVRLLRTCGTPDATPAEAEGVRLAVRRFVEEGGARPVGGTIRVAFHVITGNGEGNVSDQQITAQIHELNRGYAGTGYRFELVSVDRTENLGWFKMTPGTGKERHAKQSLAVDPAHTLNLYSCGPGQNLLGWAYFPWSAPEDSYYHGVVVHYGSLPGGRLPGYDLGRTATHEIGHYLGLLHTFQNGCTAPGDYVDDTPYEAVPAYGCPVGRNTCPDPGEDPIHNYMDYSDDECLTEFSAGQDDRMDAVLPVYRPSLFLAAVGPLAGQSEIEPDVIHPGDITRGIEFRGAAPNPFRSQTAVRFSIPIAEHVTLRVYDVAGKLVRTVMDAQLPPGDHSAVLSGRDLPPGMYFTVLRVGGAQMSRSVVLIR